MCRFVVRQHGAVGSNLFKPTMNSPIQNIPAVSVRSSDLNQGPTADPNTSTWGAAIGGAVTKCYQINTK